MKKLILIIAISLVGALVAGCSQADKVSVNLSKEADNFNVIRRLTVINCISNDILFQMTGKMSLAVDTEGGKIDVIVEDENGNYQKHFVGISDNVTYTIEQLQAENVSNYKFSINYNPKMWMPVDIKTID